MTMIDSLKGSFQYFQISMIWIAEVAMGNMEFIDKSSARISHLFMAIHKIRYA